jgi:hypothetical protein
MLAFGTICHKKQVAKATGRDSPFQAVHQFRAQIFLFARNAALHKTGSNARAVRPLDKNRPQYREVLSRDRATTELAIGFIGHFNTKTCVFSHCASSHLLATVVDSLPSASAANSRFLPTAVSGHSLLLLRHCPATGIFT